MDEVTYDFKLILFSIVYSFDRISGQADTLNRLIIDCLDKNAPLQKIKFTRPPSPWMKDLGITQLQLKRNDLRQKACD